MGTISAGETIGNSNCSCIFEFDKHYIVKSLEEVIKKEEDEIENIKIKSRELVDKMKGLPAEGDAYAALADARESYPGIIRIHEAFKRDLITVRKRVQNTPTCKE